MERTIVCQRNGENNYKMYVFVAVTKRVAAGNYAFGGGCLMSQRDLHQPLIFQKELHINIQLLFSISYITLFQFYPCYSFHPLFTQCLFPFLFPFVIFSLISLVQTNQQMKLSMYSHCKQNCVKFQKVCIRLTRRNKCWQCLQTRGMLKLFFRFNFHFFLLCRVPNIQQKPSKITKMTSTCSHLALRLPRKHVHQSSGESLKTQRN